MVISVEWKDEEKTTFVGTIDWPWTWDEMRAAWETANAMMDSVSHTVHMVVNCKTSRFPPGNVMTNIQLIMRYMSPNLGLSIVVTQNHFQEIINRLLFRAMPRLNKTGHVVPTLEAAYKLIEKEASKTAGK